MFNTEEKKKISAAIEKVLLEIDHPEMPKERPRFSLHVLGRHSTELEIRQRQLQ